MVIFPPHMYIFGAYTSPSVAFLNEKSVAIVRKMCFVSDGATSLLDRGSVER
jgi:hypothetical protein